MTDPAGADADRALDPYTLGMQAHPEGGWYRRTWQHHLHTTTPGGPRPLSSCVAFLLRPGERSAWHRVASAELWLWQGGGLLRLSTAGTADRPGPEQSVDLGQGGQYLVQPAEWQSAQPASARPVLVACVVSPGFDFADFELA